MPRVIVITEPGAVLLDEQVYPVHLADEHCSLQFLERLAWAIEDAAASEVAVVGGRAAPENVDDRRPVRRAPHVDMRVVRGAEGV